MENEPVHILLADDDETDRLLFTEAFSELELKTFVRSVNTGMQLIEWLNIKNIRLPDLIFLDLNMPRKNGLECLQEIRSNPNLKAIPIAIYSTSNSETDIEETFRKGANIYIHKPADYELLKQTLKKAVMTVYEYQGQAMKRENFFLRL